MLSASWIQLIDWNLSIDGGIAFGLSCINSSPGGLLLPDLHQLPHFLRPGAMHMLWSALLSKFGMIIVSCIIPVLLISKIHLRSSPL